MLEALQGVADEVINLSPLKQRLRYPLKAIEVAHNRVLATSYRRDREPFVANGYRQQIKSAIERFRPDLVISPSTIPVATLDTPTPFIFWTDATFNGMLGYYPDFTNLSPRYLRVGESMESRALSRASLAVYTSEWAAESAREHYGLSSEKVVVVPYGANFANVPRAKKNLDLDPVRLLCIGGDWVRKGIDTTVNLAIELNRRGVPTILDTVGCLPPSDSTIPEFVHVHPYLDKAVDADRQKLEKLLRAASFFALPSRADCTPIVLAEAQAYGVPVLATRTGGIESMISNGESGQAFESSAFVQNAANLVESASADPSLYGALSDGARSYYEEKFRWPQVVDQLSREIRNRALV